jgi:hypothetical protein
MRKQKDQPRDPEVEPETKPEGVLALVLDLLPIVWLLLVLSAYALLALHPMLNTRAEVPGVAEAERAVLPLLAALVFAAIIRYYWLRKARPRSPEAGSGRQRG